MRRNGGCLLLALLLTCARAEYLLARTPAGDAPAGRPAFAQRFCPTCVSFRQDIQERLELGPLGRAADGPSAERPGATPPAFPDRPPQALSSAERRYLLMSLRP
jgi:hypothetical protein